MRSGAPPLILLFALLLGGCTVSRMEHDTAQVLEWLRLKSRTDSTTVSRWQLPRQTHISVRETAPAPHPDWLSAAQAGVDSIFPGDPGAGDEPLILQVSWPTAQPDRVMWPDFQAPVPMRIALLRAADGALLESAELTAQPHWFTAQGTSPDLVRRAFRSFAAEQRGRF
jgi:hypothetical protein